MSSVEVEKYGISNISSKLFFSMSQCMPIFNKKKSHQARAVECFKLWDELFMKQTEGLLRQNTNISGSTVQREDMKNHQLS